MARKKIVKQKQKQQVSQKVNVKVIVGDREGKKSKRQYRRRMEPQVETISAKTLAPVFIQPPVVSLLSGNADVPRASVTLPTEVFVPQQPVAEPKGRKLGNPQKQEMEDLRTVAEPFIQTKKERLEDVDFVVPVDKHKVDEGFGIFYSQTLKDTELTKGKEDKISLNNMNYEAPAFIEDANRDISAYNSPFTQADKEFIQSIEEVKKEVAPLKKQYTTRKTTKKQINAFRLYALDRAVDNMTDEEVGDYIFNLRESNNLTFDGLMNKYADKRKKQREEYSLRTFKVEKPKGVIEESEKNVGFEMISPKVQFK
jgi:hypothetical protein